MTHVHPSWLGYIRINMSVAAEDRWEISLDAVPLRRSHAIRINDPNACATDPNGATTRNVFANGVLLTRIVNTPGNGPEPGLAFTVTEDGQIIP